MIYILVLSTCYLYFFKKYLFLKKNLNKLTLIANMKRKIISVGRTAVAVTLPSKWYKPKGLNRGDTVTMDIENDVLLVKAEAADLPLKKIEIDVAGFDSKVIRWVLSSLHKKGFDEIKIYYGSEPEIKSIREILATLYTGFAIVDQADSYLVAKSIMQETSDEFHNIFRRAFRVTITMGSNCLDLIKKKRYSDLPKLLDLEHTNNQLVNYCQRIINKGIIADNPSFYYVLLWNLEKVCDDYKYVCSDLKGSKTKISDDVVSRCSHVMEYLEGYYNLFYNFEMRQLIALNNRRLVLKREFDSMLKSKLSVEERILTWHFAGNLPRIADFSTSMVAIRHDPLK